MASATLRAAPGITGPLPAEPSCPERAVHGGSQLYHLFAPQQQTRADGERGRARSPAKPRRSLLTSAVRGDRRGVHVSAVAEGKSTFQAAAPWEDRQSERPLDLGHARNLGEVYEFGEELGKGGNGLVRLVTHKSTGASFACKTLPKRLVVQAGKVSELKAQRHISSIRNEVEVMRRLRGTLNVAHLEQVFEDDDSVHIVMEHCRGGELLHTLGQKHYSEQTVASVMRAVLRTLAQCHSHDILHLDIKPGNFMLLDGSDTAPLKAIDFGLARPFHPEELPISDLGLEGTPWFMAPEMLRSEVTPACDIWAAGVMAYQLLTGVFPFDDKKNPYRPAVSNIWRSLLNDKLSFNKSYWDDISDEAKAFVEQLLNKDPKERPTAKQALQHPWLQGGSVEDRFSTKSKGLKTEVVQRIQRYGQSTLVRRTLLEYLVDEMLADDTVPPPGSTYPANGTVTLPSCNLDLNALKKHLEVAGEGQPVDYATMERLLHKLGYRLHPEEVEHLMQAMDIGRSGRVTVSQFVASQIDWPAVERLHNELFAESARRAFSSLDIDGDGLITKDELCLVLQSHLATDDLQPAVEEALKEMELKGCSSGSGTMDINGFMSLLHAPSYDSLLSLDQYDEKMSSCPSSTSLDTLLADLESSIRDGSLHNTKEWQELEKSVKNGKLHNTKEWQDLEKSVKGAKALHALFGHNSNKTHGHENSQSAAQRQESCADTN